MEPPADPDGGDPKPVRRALDIVAGHGWVVTVHDGPLEALDRLDATTEGETRLGAHRTRRVSWPRSSTRSSPATSSLVEGIEREIDALDEHALRRRPRNDVLARDRRAASPDRADPPDARPAPRGVRRPGRPEMELHEELGRPWPGLTERLERAIDAVENLRDLLLGTFDIHMGRAAQDANDVMKVLTLLSAVLLPSVVLAGIMGMNFKLPFFDEARQLLAGRRGDGHLRGRDGRRGALAALDLEPAALFLEFGQGEPELGAAALARRRPDPAAHRGDQPGADEQPDPGTAGRTGGPRRAVEELEQAAGLVGREPRPVIEDADDDLGSPRLASRSIGDDRHGRPRRRRTSRRWTAGCARPARRTSGRP